MVGEVETRYIRTHTRPRRRAWLIDVDASYEDLLGLIDEMCCIWGGFHTLLIPTDGSVIHPRWLRQLRSFDPDDVVSRDTELEISKQVKELIARSCSPFRWIGGDLVLRKGLLEFETPMKTVLLGYSHDWVADVELQGWSALGQLLFLSGFGWVGPRLREILEDVRQFGAPSAIVGSGEVEVKAFPFTTEESDVKRLLALEERVVGHEPRISEMGQGEWQPPSEKEVGAAELTEIRKRLPMALTQLGLDSFFVRGIPLHMGGEEPSTCVVGRTVEDYALAHNLARLGHHVVWLPFSTFPPNKSDWLEGFLATYFAYKLARWRGVPLTSVSLSVDVMTEFGKAFVDLASEGVRWLKSKEDEEELKKEFRSRLASRTRYRSSDSLWMAPYVSFFRGTTSQDVLQFVSSLASTPLRVVQPPIRAPTTKYLNWVAEVAVQAYHPPRRSELTPDPYAAEELGLEDLQQECRVSNVGLAFAATRYYGRDSDLPASLQLQPRIRLLPPLQLFAKVLAPAGIRVSPSDKGRFLDLMVQRCGSLDALCKIIENPIASPLLSMFTSRETPSEPPVWKEVGKRRVLTTSSLATILRGSQNDVDSLLRRLLAENWLELGYALKCEHCLQSDWYPPEDVSNHFSCHRCGAQQPTLPWRDLTATAGGPGMYYRMNELAYQFLSNCGDVTARVLHALSQFEEHFTWIAECSLYRDPEEEPWIEVDILGSLSGDVAIGECRKAWPGPGAIAKDLLEKTKRFRELAERVRPDVFILGSSSPVNRQGPAREFANIAMEFGADVLVVCPVHPGELVKVGPWEG